VLSPTARRTDNAGDLALSSLSVLTYAKRNLASDDIGGCLPSTLAGT
jgi:hypothetical protein